MIKSDFLTLRKIKREKVCSLLKSVDQYKNFKNFEADRTKLKGKSIVLLFQKASTRTRVSFEVAVSQLGGHTIYLGWNESQMGRGETISDTVKVLSKYVDCIIGRVNKHEDLEEMAKYAKVPVVNALSNLYHPCQIVSDLFTIKEKFDKLEGLKLAYIGDGTNVCNSLLIGCSMMGLDISVACPTGYCPPKEIVEYAKLNANANGTKVLIFRDPVKAVRKANIVYTDTFISMGNEPQREKRLKDFLPNYQITTRLIKKAAKKAVFMHCLPAHRGEEVVTEVIDGPNSIVWDQAENRLHTSKAILTKTIFLE